MPTPAAGTAFHPATHGVLRYYPAGTAGDVQRLTDLMDMVNSGASFQQIADNIGYSSAANARRAVNRARRAVGAVIPVSLRQFGVELEFKGLDMDEAVRLLNAAGIDARSPGYTHAVVTYWKVITDASVNGGLEVVSPPLKGEQGLKDLATVMDTLSGAGGTTDRQCGMHVHLDMAGLNADEIIGFVGFYADRQESIDMLVSSSRRGTHNNYCLPLSRREIANAAPAIRNGGEPFINRYRKVNMMSYPRYGTIEVRHHQGTLNSRKAVAWIRMLLAMVTVGSAGTPAPLSLAGMLSTLVSAGGMNATASRYLLRRAEAFGFNSAAIGSATDEAIAAPHPDVASPVLDCNCGACGAPAEMVDQPF